MVNSILYVLRAGIPWRKRPTSAGLGVPADAYRRRMNNGFARVWQVAGNPCRGPTFSSCDDAQRRVPELVPAVPLG